MEDQRKKLAKLLEELQVEMKSAYWLSEKRTWYLLWRQFIAGLARGVGTALGATLIAGLVFYIIGTLASMNLPIISQFLARLITLTQMNM
ncbi:MAG: DUF5665 domain-containing protein [Firmicutes bacterium]|nr:DUF5665 domain-containing protein [Bacillota bacterium]MDD4263507.1 DUF5665 domain-containing protein [Bacillota bacterium]MDD4693742.1 DUF5665 domain-containing protein [Bacillota bacterium]